MPLKLTTTVNKIQSVPNYANSVITNEFYEYMKSNGSSEHHQNNNLKVAIAFAKFLGPDVTFYDVKKKEQIITFLDTKIKSPEQDPDRRWITTWNHYLHRIKLFFRWLYNQRGKELDDRALQSDWETPDFAKIKGKKIKRVSPYLESEIWERDEILFVTKFEPYKRNKARFNIVLGP